MKEVNLKRLHIVWFQKYDILEKANYGANKKISGCQRWGRGGEMSRQSTEDFYGSENILYDTIMIDVYHYTFVQTCGMYNSMNEP